MRYARLNLAVVVLLLAAFLFVQADLPISQAALMSPAATRQCCCSLDMQKRGMCCCCCSRGAQTKAACSLRASRCGENGPSTDTILVVKFQVVLPVLTVMLSQDGVRKPTLPVVIGAIARTTEPPVPPPRLLLPA